MSIAENIKPLIKRENIRTIEDYLAGNGEALGFGQLLGKKAVESLRPLHRPLVDPVPDFSDIEAFNEDRMPFVPQQHVIAATAKMLDSVGDGFLCGEMGTGKTLMGMLSIHKHAKGEPYRAMVLCPDHLIAVWEEEIKETIPDVEIVTFENWKSVIRLLGQGQRVKVPVKGSGGKGWREVVKWPKPVRPTWVLIGRNQSKFMPEFMGVSEERIGFNGEKVSGRCISHRLTGRADKKDATGKPEVDEFGNIIKVPIIDRLIRCPSCGEFVRGAKGVLAATADLANKQFTCKGHYLQGIPNPDQQKGERAQHGRDRLPGDKDTENQIGKVITRKGHKYKVVACEEPLWNWTRKPNRYAPSMIFQRKLKGYCKYLIIDEVHEQKSGESAQSMAAGKLMSCVDHVLALTGTLIGGYANHLFPLLVRLASRSVRAEGFEWGKDLAWSKQYGKIDRVVTTTEDAGEVSVGRRQTSMRKARSGKTKQDEYVRPGIMPTMYGRHLMANSVFIQLSQLADELPNLDEFIEDGACDLDDEQEAEYRRIEADLEYANKELLKTGSMKLLGTTLWTLMSYPDYPHGWEPAFEGTHSVGYWNKPHDKTEENWVGVTTPGNLDDKVRPKEQRLIDVCSEAKRKGRQSWVYCQLTGKRDVMPRLKLLLERAGLKVMILRSEAVPPKQRKDWIDKNGPKYDVIISNPKLVETGLTLFKKCKDGTVPHNFSNLVFYETGYNLFTLRQAARRAWRIGQPHDCTVHYLYYRHTMQHRAMDLMSRKMSAAQAIEGEFSAEGLVGMNDEDNAQMALAKSLSKQIGDAADMQRAWAKVKGGKTSKERKAVESLAFGNIDPTILEACSEELEQATALALLGVTREDIGTIMDAPAEEPAEAAGQVGPDPTPDGLEVSMDDFGSEAPGPHFPDEAKPARARSRKAKPVEDAIPELDRAQLAAMFDNLMASGLSLDDLLL